MDITAFRAPTGRLVSTIQGQSAFVPNPLPPTVDIAPILQLASEADQHLGELRGIGQFLPNPYLLIRPLQRREAIASSNIEGTYTSLSDLLILESGISEGRSSTDTLEVLNYIEALQIGMNALDELPISNRLISRLHAGLMARLPRSRSGPLPPGDYRRDQNFIGGSRDIAKSRFNPPPPSCHMECMAELEQFINSEHMGQLPALVFVSLIHYQFETIHPFPDGNGRVGRILIPLILKSRGIMEQPLLYMSQYFEDNRDEYIDLMLDVSRLGHWENWIEFFLRGVVESCVNTINTIQQVRDLQEDYRQRCQQARSSALLTQIVDQLFFRPVVTVPYVRDLTNTSYTAAQNNVNRLIEYGILVEIPSSRRLKIFVASELVRLFE